MKLTIRSVKKSDYRFLYRLLGSRKKSVRISHNKMPSWKEHCVFNDSKPYAVDSVLFDKDTPVARIYITYNNEIGMDAVAYKYLKATWDGVDAFVKDNPERFYFEVSPKNTRFINHLKKKGYKLLHYTYASIR